MAELQYMHCDTLQLTTPVLFQSTASGVSGVLGVSAVRSVERELRTERGTVTTQHRNMEEKIAREYHHKQPSALEHRVQVCCRGI